MIQHIVTTVLVFVQFTTIGLLIILGLNTLPQWYTIILILLSGIIGVIAVWNMRYSSFSIFPEVRKNAQLVNKGIYGIIRHPMYLAVFIFGIAMLVHNPYIITYTIFGILSVNMIVKLLYEEKQLIKFFPDYQNYTLKTKRLLPYIW